jgi:hypothetical protein
MAALIPFLPDAWQVLQRGVPDFPALNLFALVANGAAAIAIVLTARRL